MCYVLNDREPSKKLDNKSDELLFLGYSTNSRAYMMFNKRKKMVMESINVVVEDVQGDVPVDVNERDLLEFVIKNQEVWGDAPDNVHEDIIDVPASDPADVSDIDDEGTQPRGQSRRV